MELKVEPRSQWEDNKYRDIQRDWEFRHLQSESQSDVSPVGATLIPAGEMLECFQIEEPEAEKGSWEHTRDINVLPDWTTPAGNQSKGRNMSTKHQEKNILLFHVFHHSSWASATCFCRSFCSCFEMNCENKWRKSDQIESDRFNLTRDFVLSGRTSSCTVWRREDVSSSHCSFCLQSVWTNKTRREEEEEEVKGVAAEVSVWAWSVAPTWQPWTSTDSLTPTSKCEPSYRTHKHINCLTSGQHRCSWSAATHRREMNSLYFLCSWFIKIMWTEVWYLSTHRMKTNSEPHYWRFYLQLTVMFLISDEWNRI